MERQQKKYNIQGDITTLLGKICEENDEIFLRKQMFEKI